MNKNWKRTKIQLAMTRRKSKKMNLMMVRRRTKMKANESD